MELILGADDIEDGDILLACKSHNLEGWNTWSNYVVGESFYTLKTLRDGWPSERVSFKVLRAEAKTETLILGSEWLLDGDVLLECISVVGNVATRWGSYTVGPDAGDYRREVLMESHPSSMVVFKIRRAIAANSSLRVKCSCGKSIPSSLAGAHVH